MSCFIWLEKVLKFWKENEIFEKSIEEKKADRFREVVDEYYSFINDYPESENRKEADNIFKIAQRYVKE